MKEGEEESEAAIKERMFKTRSRFSARSELERVLK